MEAKIYLFTVIFEPLPEGGYQVSVPALPEIITAGRTIQEDRKMAKDAIRCALEGMAKDGQPIPKDIVRQPKTEKLRVALEVA